MNSYQLARLCELRVNRSHLSQKEIQAIALNAKKKQVSYLAVYPKDLKNYLSELVESNTKTVVIIDPLNHLNIDEVNYVVDNAIKNGASAIEWSLAIDELKNHDEELESQVSRLTKKTHSQNVECHISLMIDDLSIDAFAKACRISKRSKVDILKIVTSQRKLELEDVFLAHSIIHRELKIMIDSHNDFETIIPFVKNGASYFSTTNLDAFLDSFKAYE